MKNKILSIIICGIIVIGLTGCNNKLTTEESKQEGNTPICTPKKFNNKYTYVYTTEEECKNNGYNDIYDVWDAGSKYDNVTTFGCEKIVDDCGNTYYGEYFNIWVGPGVDDYQKLYY